jgi:hypothetical protein
MTREKYYESFGVVTNSLGKALFVDYKKLKKAHKRAWETRNFEIDKLWARAVYFWGFISLIFTGYTVVVTSKKCDPATKSLELYLILLGIIFTTAWLLVIKGSKARQENWENHVEWLEDEITGPLYKTTYHDSKQTYYSVTKINIILAITVIVVWGILLFKYIVVNTDLITFSKNYCISLWTILFAILPVIGAGICIGFLFLRTKSRDDRKIGDKNPEVWFNRWDD